MDTNRYPKISAAVNRAHATLPEFMAGNYARALDKIELCWGEPEAASLFDSFLMDDRENRQGFPREALSEIAYLKQIHDFFSPRLDFNPFDPFSGSAAATPSVFIPNATSAPATGAADAAGTARHGAWPVARTQRELYDLLQQKSAGKLIYPVQGKLVGEIFIHYGITDKRTLDILQSSQKRRLRKDNRMGDLLIDIGIITQDDLKCALCVQAGVIMVDLLAIPITPETARLVPFDIAQKKQAVPVLVHNDTLLFAVAEPSDFRDKAYLAMLTKHKVEPAYAPQHEITCYLNMRGHNQGRDMPGDLEFKL